VVVVKLGDIFGRTSIVILSYLIYLVMSLGFAWATTKWQIIVLFVIYGIFYSIDEAQSNAFIADVEPERRATAMGVYNFVTGVIYLPASLIAGALWVVNPKRCFYRGCIPLAGGNRHLRVAATGSAIAAIWLLELLGYSRIDQVLHFRRMARKPMYSFLKVAISLGQPRMLTEVLSP
jgi:MFS family permease